MAVSLINKFHDIITTKHLLNQKLDALESSYEEIFNELKRNDLNSIDFDDIIIKNESIIKRMGDKIKLFLIEKYANNYKFSFNINNHGLIYKSCYF